MTQILACLLGISLVAAPFVARTFGFNLGWGETALLVGSGSFVLLVTGILLVITKLYRKTRANEAFVRTGAGGARVIRDGGAIVVPFVHELVHVSLQTIKLEVSRENEDAMITLDKLRADICAEFFVRVQPDIESILQAARSLGDRMTSADDVRELVEDKLVSALRTSAASKTLEQLNSERDEFLEDVTRVVGEDLRSNGLVLETVTISKLDQTDDRFLKEANIFDAQGARKIAEITQLNLTERNRLLRDGEQHRKEQDVVARKQLMTLERHEREAEARERAEVAKTQADSQKSATMKVIESQRETELAELEKARALELAARMREQMVEVAEREKQERIAEAEQRRAAAERGLADALADREQAHQRIETVRVFEEAMREKQKQVAAAEALAETAYVADQRRADAEAYRTEKNAEAKRLAADAEAEAITKRARAESEAEQRRAEGERAKAMVPIDVARAEIDVQRDRLETVIKPELEARERHGHVAQEFELAKLRIEAEKEIRVAVAGAQASMFTKMKANLYGTTEDVTRMLDSLVRGQSAANTLNGFLGNANDDAKEIVESVGRTMKELANGMVAKAPEAAKAADAVTLINDA